MEPAVKRSVPPTLFANLGGNGLVCAGLSQLAQLLRFLERDDVEYVRLASDAQPQAHIAGVDHPLSRSAVSADQIEALVSGSPIELMLPVGNGTVEDHVTLSGHPYRVVIARAGSTLDIRVSRQIAIVTPLERAERTVTAPSRTGRTPLPPPAPTDAPPSPKQPISDDDAHRHKTAAVPTGELAAILSEARSRGATDVWLLPDKPASMRCAGVLSAFGEAIERGLLDGMLSTVVTARDGERLRVDGRVTISFELPGTGRLRVRIAKGASGLYATIRLCASPLPTPDALGLPLDLSNVTECLEGLVLIAAAPGHGATTTLAAVLSTIADSRKGAIVTLEDPIETLVQGQVSHVFQRELGRHAHSLLDGLGAAEREDAAVIALHPGANKEVLLAALDAADSGKLVVITVAVDGTSRAIESILRVVGEADRKTTLRSLARTLRMLVGVRLYPSQKPDAHAGLLPAVEVITANHELSQLLLEDRLDELPNMREHGRVLGWILMEDAERSLLSAGAVTSLDLERHSPRRTDETMTRSGDRQRKVSA